ncbi:AMP-binding protein [candidate division KSB1 bacterium]|nr:AMP-binding protein [candidate division KSB1 bacterium]
MILHHEFIKTAKKFKSKVAINDRSTNRQVSFERALLASLILAKRFKKYKEGFIGVMIPTSAGAMLTTMGVVMAGKTPVMINYSTGAAENAEYAQAKCGFKTIITSRALLEKIRCRLVPGMIFIEDIMESLKPAEKLRAALLSKYPVSWIIRTLPPSHADDNVVILFTSGSEKEPKAVQLTQRNLSSNLLDITRVYQFDANDIFMCVLPLFHVFGYHANFWLPLVTGMCAVTNANPLEFKKIPQIIREEKATIIAGTPSFFAGYLREAQPGDFNTMRIMLAGADKTPAWLRDGYKREHDIDLLEAYGTTETSPGISVNTLEFNRPGSIGKVLPSAQVKIVDLNSDAELPVGEEGKILVKGDLVMKGYLDDLEETSLRIRDGWYDTGDMGYFDAEGYLYHSGRLKRFVKIAGEMVSLVRTESVLEKVLPPGVECCVVEVPDSRKGARIIAAVTKPVKEREVVKKISQELPSIALPKQFVVLPEFPKMGSGKINFRSVTEQVREKIDSQS